MPRVRNHASASTSAERRAARDAAVRDAVVIKLRKQRQLHGKYYDEERAKKMVAACISIFAKPNGQLQLRFFDTRQAAAIVSSFVSEPAVTVASIEKELIQFIKTNTDERVPESRRLRRAEPGVEHPHYSGVKNFFLTLKGVGRFVQSMRDPSDHSQPHNAALGWSDLLNDVVKELCTELHERRMLKQAEDAATEDLTAEHRVRAWAQFEAGMDVELTPQGKFVPTGFQRSSDGKFFKLILTDPDSEKKRLSVEECCRLIGNPKKRSESASSKLTLVGKPALQFYRTMSALHTRANIGKRLTPGLTLEQRNAIVVELENTILAQMKPMVCGELSVHGREDARILRPERGASPIACRATDADQLRHAGDDPFAQRLLLSEDCWSLACGLVNTADFLSKRFHYRRTPHRLGKSFLT